MEDDEVDMTYAMYREADEDSYYRLERILGTSWTYDDVRHVSGGESKEARYVHRDQAVRYPLAFALNPTLINDLRSRYGVGDDPKDFDHGDGIGGAESMFFMDKEEFLKRTDARYKAKSEDDEDEIMTRPMRSTRRG
jgi:hypothetical protein